ncbi:MFS transporter [Cryptosporangium aurantiacum]|uniref:Drug resistance transporter, EmrB/QacA subfamily n=1 Tax=Cryptosporangium aurantiacum TaxID=134849 RepID=A0A1M7P8L2_9ACTN|nr:MFS transporter [Cryptosporangium aurantiacum]SHN13000.1 drug resistance transporter, EmrB/QacA subfamily [Cryptosporangium aurantiacum]
MLRTERPRRGLVLALACASTAMVGLDVAIVNVALPSIQSDLGVGPGALQWVVVAYALLLGGFLLVGGRMADQLGRRRVFLAGLVIFTAASFVAGAAQQAGVLIAARGLQGFGAALVAPAALSLIAVTFAEGRERARAVGIFGGVAGVAGSVGVVAGGLLTAGPGWRWAFLLNVPAGVVFVVSAVLFLAPDQARDRAARLDLAGASAVTGGLLLFVYALHHGATEGWISGSTAALFVAAVGLLVAFARIEARSAAPLVPPATWRNRSLVAANAAAFLAYCALFSFIFLGSLLMQQALGYSPLRTGVAWLATTATSFVAAVVGGRLVGVAGVRWVLISGLSLVTAGALWLTRIPAAAGYPADLLPAFLLVGVGFGFCGPALQIGALSGVSRSASGLASGLVETMREIGGAAGVAVVSTVLVARSGLAGFHAAFALIGLLAALGVVTAGVGLAGVEERPLADVDPESLSSSVERQGEEACLGTKEQS